MTIDVAEFHQYLRIDKTALDDDVIEQPMLFFKVSEAFMGAAAERDALKEKLALVDAKIDAEIRRNTDVKRLTDAAVKARIQTTGKHAAAFEAYVDAKERADVLQALKDAFQQRSYMLRDMVQLYVANYFQDASMKGTNQSDTLVYNKRREQLAEARVNKKRV